LSVVVGRGHAVMPAAALERLLARVPEVLAPHPAGLSRERLLGALPGTGGEVLDEALTRLLAAGTVRQHGGILAVPRPDADRARARSEALLASDLADALRRGGLTPPDAAAIAAGLEGKRALDRLVREGVAVRAHDRVQKRVILFHQEAVEEAQRRLAPLLARPPGLLVSEVGSALGISRKFSVPLLEHLDHIRFTRRIQNRRILAAVKEGG
jgi:selenocysteine-specific elongation factor